MTPPSREDINRMTPIELLDTLVHYPEVASPVRYRIRQLMDSAGTNSCRGIVSDEFSEHAQETAIAAEPLDMMELYVGRKKGTGAIIFAKAILESSWDHKDHRNIKKPMYKMPEEVVDFLESVIRYDLTYETMSQGQTAMMDTISHAFIYWWNNHK